MKKILSLLPLHLREPLSHFIIQDDVSEIRLRYCQVVSLVKKSKEIFLVTEKVAQKDLEYVLAKACEYSLHSVQSQISRGYLTMEGGHRLGICGSVVMEDGKVSTLKDISSISIRIAKEFTGIAKKLVPQLIENGQFHNTLLLSPPGFGKTTLLRDMIKELSTSLFRVSVVDERGEIAAMQHGMARFDVGQSTDVLDGCPKSMGLLFLLRSMNPQILAVDEITEEEDVESLIQVSGCGVKLLATAHGATSSDLFARPVYQRLMAFGLFQRLIRIEMVENTRTYIVENL